MILDPAPGLHSDLRLRCVFIAQEIFSIDAALLGYPSIELEFTFTTAADDTGDTDLGVAVFHFCGAARNANHHLARVNGKGVRG